MRRRRWRGTRAPLKGRRPPLPTEWGVHEGWEGAWALCFYYWLLCTPRKASPPQGMLGCYDLCLEAGVHPNGGSPPSQTGSGCSITKACSILIPDTAESHLHLSLCEKGNRLSRAPYLHPGGQFILHLTNATPPLPRQGMAKVFWFCLVFDCQNPLLRLQLCSLLCSGARLMNLLVAEKLLPRLHIS